MNTIVRTTVSFPNDLYDLVQMAAMQQKLSVSSYVNRITEKQLGYKKLPAGQGIASFMSMSKFVKLPKDYKFDRKKFYDEEDRRNMPVGY